MRQDGTLDVWLRAGVTVVRQLNPLIHGAGAALSAGTETIDMRSLFTAAFGEVGASSGGVGASSAIGAKVARYGQRESYQSLGGVDEMSQISVLGSIADASSIFTNSRTFTIDPTIVGARPYIDFQLGDTIKIVAQSLKDYVGTTVTVSTARVLGWGWRVAVDGTQQCDLVLDTILQHQRRFFQSEQLISQGDIPVVNLTAATVSNSDGRLVGTEPSNASVLIGPTYQGLIAFVQSNGGVP